MSLECEGQGGVCEVCGQFDFLPTECPQCHRLLCREHVRRHHASSTSTEWCACGITGHNPHDAPAASLTAADDEHHDTDVPAPGVRCHVCGSSRCVLCPCEQCHENFCAAHRFHGHEDAADVGRRRRPRHTSGDEPTATNAEEVAPTHDAWLAQRCRQFTSAACLALAPPQYRSRMMPVTAVLVHSPVAPDDGPCACLPDVPRFTSGVCSVSAATEASIGQLVEHLVLALELWRLPYASGADMGEQARQMRAVQRALPFKVESTSATDPPFQLSALPLAALTREALTPQDVLCVHLSASLDEPALPVAVASLLFSPPSGGDGKRDARLHALATRLRLRAAAADKAKVSPAPSDAAAAHANTADERAVPSLPPPPRAVPANVCRWPFRTAAPLTAATFANTKNNPLGRGAVSAKAGAVTVAVFVEDVDLSAAVPPFCCVVSTAWSYGRLLEQVASCVEQVARGVSAKDLATCDLWWLNETSPTGEALLKQLTSDKEDGRKPIASLSNGDVLLCGYAQCTPAGAKYANDTVQAEVDRLRQAKGREQAALRMHMMKQCAVM